MESDSDNVSAPAFGSLTRSHGDSDDATYVDVEVAWSTGMLGYGCRGNQEGDNSLDTTFIWAHACKA
eukprot:341283-Chlamydomonas_euryale.AAC.5